MRFTGSDLSTVAVAMVSIVGSTLRLSHRVMCRGVFTRIEIPRQLQTRGGKSSQIYQVKYNLTHMHHPAAVNTHESTKCVFIHS